jgi:hypothetical protein
LEGYLDPALLPQVQAHRASFWGAASSARVKSSANYLTPKQLNAGINIKFDGGEWHGTHVHGPLDIKGCWAHAKGKISACITKEMNCEADGLSDNLNILVGMEQWTATAADCLDIKDMRNIDTVEADDPELKDAGSNFDSTPIRLTRWNNNHVYFGGVADFATRGLQTQKYAK